MKKPTRSEVLFFRTTPKQRQALERAARKTEQAPSALLAAIVREWLEKQAA